MREGEPCIPSWLTVIITLGFTLGLVPFVQAGASCTTSVDKDFQVYRTPCTNGRQFKSQYDRDFGVYRMRELPPWNTVTPKKGR